MEDSSRYDLPDSPQSIGWTEARHCVVADSDDPFLTDSGAVLPYVEVEYETYGTPAADGSNCILVCHALSGDAHAAGGTTSSVRGRASTQTVGLSSVPTFWAAVTERRVRHPSTPKQGGRMGWSFPSSLSETGCVFKSGCWKSWESRICTR